ncbi:nose resistant to fluoxetine protein 6-like [Glandiceps talaboti]
MSLPRLSFLAKTLIFLLITSATFVDAYQHSFYEAVRIKEALLSTNGLQFGINDELGSNVLRGCQERNDCVIKHSASEQCYNDVLKFDKDLSNREVYATHMMDAMGKFPAGLIKANFKWIGTRRECFEATRKYSNITEFNSVYCLAGYNIPIPNYTLPIGISTAICVPDTCTEEDVEILLVEGILPTPPLVGAVMNEFDFSFVHCSYHESLSTGAIVMICIAGVFGFIVVCASLYEYFTINNSKGNHNYDITANNEVTTEDMNYDKPSVWKELLLSFSCVSNGSRILDQRIDDHGDDAMTSLYGLGVLTMWWVLLGQVFYFHYRFMSNFFDIDVILATIMAQATMNYRYAEDTFFILSGLLVTYYPLRRLSETGSYNWVYFYIHRLWRYLDPVGDPEGTSSATDDHIDTKPYTRMTPYLVGMVVAYLIVKYGTKVKINKTYIYIPHLAFSYFAGFVFALVVEKPMLRIERTLVKKWYSNAKPTEEIKVSQETEIRGDVSKVNEGSATSHHYDSEQEL